MRNFLITMLLFLSPLTAGASARAVKECAASGIRSAEEQSGFAAGAGYGPADSWRCG